MYLAPEQDQAPPVPTSSQTLRDKSFFSKEKIEKNLNDNFPRTYIYVHSITLAIIGIIEIVLQIILISFNIDLSYISNGIWAGLFLIVLGILSILLAWKKTHNIFMCCYFSHLISIIIILIGLVILNVVSIVNYNYEPDPIGKGMIPINAIMLFMGMMITQSLKISQKNFHLTSFNALVSKEFEDSKARLATLKEDPGNDVKLKLYALFKQATVGKCNTSKPSMVDFVGRAKWNAWNELKSMSTTEAEKEYINLINELLKNQQVENSSVNTEPTKFQDIKTSIEFNNVYKIVLNRPSKLNAITIKMYNELIEALKEAENNPNVLMVCITGAGDYYCSGNDLTNFSTQAAMNDIKKAAQEGGVLLENFVNSFINFPKPLVALVNGPAVGISVTILGLFDMVLASDKATFNAPFTKIAQSPEACSSYTFAKMMGPIKAAEFLLFNRKLTAQEAFERNLVTEIIPHDAFQVTAWKKIEDFSKLPKESLLESRKLMKDAEKEVLRQINKKEVEVLVGRWSSNEFVRVIMEFWGNRSKK
ncbi:unnamed protein product [Brachionus calyciflorus]|uniref:ACB domain-containing protein n=1 Tax=Brachionus calyciflorus TaxID=104777 RepID=A0A813TR69_9BILA|nr:unnamed protein product [Brachionus calyciflorus]